MIHFNFYTQKEISQNVNIRSGEIKIGEKILISTSLAQLMESNAKYVILGCPESIGPRANFGQAGTETAWEAFLPKFLNVQQSNFLQGERIAILGHFNFSEQEKGAKNADLNQLRKLVAEMDKSVAELIAKLVAHQKIPIVIGGGHNNAYGLLKGTSSALNQSINCINLDPHADYRLLEGRHSGNGFSYAKAEGYLDKYSIVGLHENYNSKEMMNRMESDQVDFTTYEAIFIRNELNFEEAVKMSLRFVGDKPFGVELDCDAIENFPSSAQTPSGITQLQARRYIHHAASLPHVAYLHLPEAAPILVKNSSAQVGKMLSYLVTDFIKSNITNHRK